MNDYIIVRYFTAYYTENKRYLSRMRTQWLPGLSPPSKGLGTRLGNNVHEIQPLCMETLKNQLYISTDDPVAKACLLSVSTKEAGTWLNVLPVPHLGTELDDTTVVIGLRGALMHLWCIRSSQWHTWPQLPQEWGKHSETSGGK